MLALERTSTKHNRQDMSTSTSLHVLRAHIKYSAEGSLDASGVISIACYEAWIATRKHSNAQATTYYRVLTNHLSGVVSTAAFAASTHC